MPDRASAALPCSSWSPSSVTEELPPSVKMSTELGFVRSTWNGPTVWNPWRPTRSVAEPWTLIPVPSAAEVAGPEQNWMPEPASPQMKFTVTFALYQPFWLGWVVGVPLIVGGWVSIE